MQVDFDPAQGVPLLCGQANYTLSDCAGYPV